MSRPHRELAPESCYHVTTRCNNREFHLTQPLCRNLLLYALSQAIKEFGFKLYALCLMSNHVHYLLEPAQPADLPRLMHWLNWYSARCFNRLLRRTGHFWERRYHSSGFARDDHVRALNTLRYIHGNPRAAGIQTSFSDPTGLQVLKKCRVSGRRHFCHPTSFQGRGCENGRSTEDPASGS